MDDGANAAEPDDPDDMPFAARFYYRTILDRFKHLPVALAKRYAQANLRRAQRLQMARGEKEEDIRADPTMPRTSPGDTTSNAPTFPSSSNSSLSLEPPEPVFQYSYSDSEDIAPERYSRRISLWTGKERSPSPHSDSEDNDPARYSVKRSFWTGKERSPRPQSNSGSSSMNSSLQSEDSPGQKSDSSSSIEQSLPNMELPPPPMELGSQQALVCDICGETVHIALRKEWR